MVQSAIHPLAPGLLERIGRLPVATITGLLNERGLSNIFMQGVMPLDSSMKICAQAFTLRYLPKREDLTKGQTREQRAMRPQRHAIDHGIAASQVLVIDAGGRKGSGVIGDLLGSRLKYRGGVGVVTDGAFRDAAAQKEMGLMLFGCGSSGSGTPHAHYDADYGLPIQCGGVTVIPGDVIVGDADGVVVIPRALAEEIAEAGEALEEFEAFIRGLIESGVPLAEANPPTDEYRQQYEQQRAQRGAGRGS